MENGLTENNPGIDGQLLNLSLTKKDVHQMSWTNENSSGNAKTIAREAVLKKRKIKCWINQIIEKSVQIAKRRSESDDTLQRLAIWTPKTQTNLNKKQKQK